MSDRELEGQSPREDFGPTAREEKDDAMPRDDIIYDGIIYTEFKDILSPGLLRAVGRLRNVREPGRGRLTLREARQVAVRQAEAYARAFREGRPVRHVEVWVEGGRVMSVAPGDTARLKDFNFEVASAADAVLQVCKAEEGEERVVLLTVPLPDVPDRGRTYAAELPNGQKYTLEIKPEGAGRFGVRFAFDTPECAPEPTCAEDPAGGKPGTGLAGRAAATMYALLNSWPALLPRYLLAFFIPVALMFALPVPHRAAPLDEVARAKYGIREGPQAAPTKTGPQTSPDDWAYVPSWPTTGRGDGGFVFYFRGHSSGPVQLWALHAVGGHEMQYLGYAPGGFQAPEPPTWATGRLGMARLEDSYLNVVVAYESSTRLDSHLRTREDELAAVYAAAYALLRQAETLESELGQRNEQSPAVAGLKKTHGPARRCRGCRTPGGPAGTNGELKPVLAEFGRDLKLEKPSAPKPHAEGVADGDNVRTPRVSLRPVCEHEIGMARVKSSATRALRRV